MDSSLLSPINAALAMWAILLAHGVVHTLSPAQTVVFYGVPEGTRAHCHVPIVSLGAHLLFTCTVVAWTIVAPFLGSDFIDDGESPDFMIRHKAYATASMILALMHLWAFLNKEISKLGGSDMSAGVLFLMDCMFMVYYGLFAKQQGAAFYGGAVLALCSAGFLFAPKHFASLLWRFDDKFFEGEARGPYLMLVYRGIGVVIAQSVVLVTSLELNRSPIQSFGFSCIALTTGVLSLPFWNPNAAKISLTARHLAMGAAGAMISSLMILHEAKLPIESPEN